MTELCKCALCGWIDHRHRTVETQMGRVIAGDSIQEVAEDYGYSSYEDMISDWQSVYDVVFEFAADKMRGKND